MTKFKKTFATALTLALVFGVGSKAFADEDTDSLFNILTTDIAENQEDKSQEGEKDKDNNYETDPAYKEEFDARFNLYQRIILAKEMGNIEIDGFIDILNKKAATKEDLEKALVEINKLIDESDEKIALDLDIDGVKRDVRDYILYGKLFFLDNLDKKDIKNLYLFYEATVNSYTFTRSSDEEKKPLMPVLEEIYDYILEIDEKVKGKIEISEEDKTKTNDLINKLEKALEEKIKENANTESTEVEKTSYQTGGDEVDGELNEDSAFYKSDKEGIKDAYTNLDKKQREFLDQINKDNNDEISEEEINEGGYSLPLEGPSEFIKPFLVNQTDKKSVELESKEVASETSKEEPSKEATTTAPNPNSSNPPETVTLSQGENTQGTEEKEEVKKEDAPPLLTRAASQVKTGIESIGYLGIILVVAIIAFVVLNKKKEDK